ncbi:MAG: hypothetical protein ABSA46_15205 [Thermodesulfovibrionales bacterium]|jgi:hypothetical protein
MQTYKGILVLDDSKHESYLQMEDPPTLMMLDETTNGAITHLKVNAAYWQFHNDPQVDNGDIITVSGFYDPEEDPVLRFSNTNYQKV